MDHFVQNYYSNDFDFGFILTNETFEDLIRDGRDGNIPDTYIGVDFNEYIPGISYIIPTTEVSLYLQDEMMSQILALRKLYVCNEEVAGCGIYWRAT